MLFPFLGALLAAWLVVASYVIWKIRKSQNQLLHTSGKQAIEDVLNKIIKDIQKTNSDIITATKSLNELKLNSQYHLCKTGVVHFNPFGHVAGKQSFVVAILDRLQNGLVINFIYTHEGVRVYTKKIKSGKGQEYDLSAEEKEAVIKAQ